MTEGLIGPLGHAEIKTLRGLSQGDAGLWLASKYPDLLAEDFAIAMQLAGRDLKKATPTTGNYKYDPTRRLWLAASWLLGASWRNLAHMHQVAAPTVLAVVNRILPKEARSEQRIGYNLELEKISLYHASFNKNLQYLSSLTPLEIAQWLLANTDLED